MAPANRMPVSDLRKFAVAALIVVGVFLLCCGTGMSNVVVGGAGVLLAVGGPLLVLFTSARGNAKLYVYGTAHVVEVSALPAAGTTGRCELELVINARGIDGVPVRIRDAAVPVNKWPDVGATLPVRVVPGNARKVTILWDEVRTHREAAYDDRMYPGFATLSDEERAQIATEDVEFDHGPLPPDDRPTVTDLPLIEDDAVVEEVLVGADDEPIGGPVLVSDRATPVPAPRAPEASASPVAANPVIVSPLAAGLARAAGVSAPTDRAADAAVADETGTADATRPADGTRPADSSRTGDAIGTADGTGAAEATPSPTPGAAEEGTDPAAGAQEAASQAASNQAAPNQATSDQATGSPATASHTAGSSAAAVTPAAASAAASATAASAMAAAPSPIRRKPSPRPRRSGRAGRAGTGPGGGGSGVAPPPRRSPAHAAPDEVEAYETPEPDITTTPTDIELVDAESASVEPAGFEAQPAEPDVPAGEPGATALEAAPEATEQQEAAELEAWPEPVERAAAAPRSADLQTAEPHSAEPNAAEFQTAAAETAAAETVAPETAAEPESTADAEITAEPQTTANAEITAGPDITAEHKAAEAETTAGAEIAAEPEATADAETQTTAGAEITAGSDITAEHTATAESEITAQPEIADAELIEPEILESHAPPRELRAAAHRAEEEPDDVYLPNPYVTEIYAPLPEDLTPELATPRAEAMPDEVDPADELEPLPFQDGAVAQFLAATPRHRSVPLASVNGVSVTLIVSDLQRSRRFYRDTLGLSELDSSPTSAVLASGDARVVLRRVADMPPVDRRVVHLNLEVPDVYEAYERLRADGVEFVHRPRVVPQGEQLDLCSATFRDPDGHAIALTRWELRR